MPQLEGAYSTVVMTKRAVVAFRDPHGVRPLSLGQLDDQYCVASESCAFDIIGAKLLREVQPGELISIGERGIETRQVVEPERPAHCVFEHIYFSRPDSRLEGHVLQEVRGKMGEILWREAPVDADLVISVDTSVALLAGALGRPLWILLPFWPDWRWTLDRDASPWYPDARLFRQGPDGDWDPVIERVSSEIATLLAS